VYYTYYLMFTIFIMAGSYSDFYLATGIVSAAYSVFAFASYYTFSGADLIDAKKARKMIKKGDIDYVIDVRTTTEWKLGHYPSAEHIPTDRITKTKLEKLSKDYKDKTFLVYCNTGQRARSAAEKLRSYGVKEAYYISGTYLSILDHD